ncbi:hypothetical protein [Fluviicola sp.]|uniref:hypothetical protein n=1 Tax=Fluviicola sp. TaxID=1917219 RepID=UPI0031E12C4A
MLNKWTGTYRYDSEKIQRIVGHPYTRFTIEMELFENDTLKGTVQDDPDTGGMSGIGTISGEIHQGRIYFEKQMPVRSVILDKQGNRKTTDEQHPVLFYEGKLTGENKYAGTWTFEKTWGFLFGFIPVKYCPGRGTWEMELLVD